MTSTPDPALSPDHQATSLGGGAASRSPAGGVPDAGRAAGDGMGDALRSIYQQTIDESVPDEMIDLLGRLA